MTKIEKLIAKDLGRAKSFIIKAEGSRPQLCRDIGVGLRWAYSFIRDETPDPSYSKVVRILEYIKQQKNQ